MELALTCTAFLIAAACAIAVLPLRARVDQLELERPRFKAELEGLVDACTDILERADAKRKRADAHLARLTAEQQPSLPIPRRTGTVIERLPQ